ncbi:hypothetical protein G4V62_13885 [Bacillaceae bacterium SIJ1]|uniref:hypothetical protein n=1 Tax=Litoribacterium kuwaitense TaxID=1398745 RepID=UPI0013ED6E23|nr:hypothetical protein [Litoribacterium kuwaitense]NGP45985.1 hypothetical protein [Litoribacterium kuwaitense]
MTVKRIIERMTPAHEQDDDFRFYVSDLLSLGQFQDDAAVNGIAKLIVDKGPEELTPKQKNLFAKYGLSEHLYTEYCKWCMQEISWNEMLSAIEDDLCSYCRNKIEKDD